MIPARMVLAACILLGAWPVLAHQGGPRMSGRTWIAPMVSRDRDADEEGRVVAEVFVVPAAVAADGAATPRAIRLVAPADAPADQQVDAIYEAAFIDGLVDAGYDTIGNTGAPTQEAELRVLRREVAPAEKRRGPVSGSMEVGIGSHGTSTAMAISVDLSRPEGALVSTRLDARVRNRQDGAVLWEGRATIVTREGSDHWSDAAIAQRLSRALFARLRAETGG